MEIISLKKSSQKFTKNGDLAGIYYVKGYLASQKPLGKQSASSRSLSASRAQGGPDQQEMPASDLFRLFKNFPKISISGQLCLA